MSDPQRLSLELSIVLPSVSDERDGCVQRLTTALQGQPGIDMAHVKIEGDQPRLCIHYDPAQVPLRKVRELALSTGAGLTERYGHVTAEHGPTRPRREASRRPVARNAWGSGSRCLAGGRRTAGVRPNRSSRRGTAEAPACLRLAAGGCRRDGEPYAKGA
jgi:hypothetical protein